MTNAMVRISEDDRNKLHDLSKRQALSMKDYVHAMIIYFDETDWNPASKQRTISEEIAAMRKEVLMAIKESRNTYVSFMREQEKTKLSPIIKQVNDITETLVREIHHGYLPQLNQQSSSPFDNTTALEVQGTNYGEVAKSTIGRNVAVSDYAWMLARARELFENFVKNGKRSTFGSGWVFDGDTVDWYQKEFAKLIF